MQKIQNYEKSGALWQGPVFQLLVQMALWDTLGFGYITLSTTVWYTNCRLLEGSLGCCWGHFHNGPRISCSEIVIVMR